VTIARDLGSVVELASGLARDDRVIQNPPDGIANGAEVHLVGTPPRGAQAAAARSKNAPG
jgi:hypothetical protein